MLSITLGIVLTGVLVAVNAALLGTFLVVRGQAMVTDAISHGILPGIAVSFAVSGAVNSPFTLIAAGLSGLATVLLIDWLTRVGVQRDSATGLVFPAFFALGILIFFACGSEHSFRCELRPVWRNWLRLGVEHHDIRHCASYRLMAVDRDAHRECVVCVVVLSTACWGRV